MAHALTSVRQGQADPRLLKVQVGRAAKAIRASVVGSPLWVCFFAAMCSKPVPFLGKVSLERAIAVVLIVTAAAGFPPFSPRLSPRNAQEFRPNARWGLHSVGLRRFCRGPLGARP